MADDDTSTDDDTSDDTTTTDDTSTDATSDDTSSDDAAGDGGASGDDEPLGDAGKKALADERQARRDAEKKARENADRVKELEREKLSDSERQEQQSKDDRERADRLEARVKRGEVLDAATGKDITNPKLAADLIDPSKVELDDDGKAINADDLLDDLVRRYPELKAKPEDEEREKRLGRVLKNGDRVNDDNDDKSQLSSTEGMSPEEIAKALEEGRLDDYLKKQ